MRARRDARVFWAVCLGQLDGDDAPREHCNALVRGSLCKEPAPTDVGTGSRVGGWQRPTLPCPRRHSTIGADGLNCRVRNGNGCGPVALVTSQENIAGHVDGGCCERHVRGRDQATRAISTARLKCLHTLHLPPINVVVYHGPSGTLRSRSVHLGAGFPLRCFQRLSLPDIATRRCHWRDSRNTSGQSDPVLSY
jgi:hypothetical protein